MSLSSFYVEVGGSLCQYLISICGLHQWHYCLHKVIIHEEQSRVKFLGVEDYSYRIICLERAAHTGK